MLFCWGNTGTTVGIVICSTVKLSHWDPQPWRPTPQEDWQLSETPPTPPSVTSEDGRRMGVGVLGHMGSR